MAELKKEEDNRQSCGDIEVQAGYMCIEISGFTFHLLQVLSPHYRHQPQFLL